MQRAACRLGARKSARSSGYWLLVTGYWLLVTGDSLPPESQDRYARGVERIIVDLPREWLSVADVCEYMGVSAYVVTRLLRSEQLPAVKMGREWRVARGDFEDWLNAQRLASALRTNTR